MSRKSILICLSLLLLFADAAFAISDGGVLSKIRERTLEQELIPQAERELTFKKERFVALHRVWSQRHADALQQPLSGSSLEEHEQFVLVLEDARIAYDAQHELLTSLKQELEKLKGNTIGQGKSDFSLALFFLVTIGASLLIYLIVVCVIR